MATGPQERRSAESIGSRLAWALKQKGMTQSAAAEALGIARPTINRWINDPNHPPGEQSLSKLAEALDVSVAWLRYGTPDSARRRLIPYSEKPAPEVLLAVATILRVSESLPLTAEEERSFRGGLAAFLVAMSRAASPDGTVAFGLREAVTVEEGVHKAQAFAAENELGWGGYCSCGTDCPTLDRAGSAWLQHVMSRGTERGADAEAEG